MMKLLIWKLVHNYKTKMSPFLDRDGIPPYRIRKQHRREMHESAKANGRVPLPHIPVSISSVNV